MNWQTLRYPILPVTIFVVWTISIVLFYTLSDYSWEGWTRSDGYPHVYCEQASGKPLEQFSNSFSNLVYMLVGLLIVFRPVHLIHPIYDGQRGYERRNLFCSHWVYPATMGFSVIMIGWGSLFYHGSLTSVGRFFDWFGMYMFANFFYLYALARVVGKRNWPFLFSFVMANMLAIGAILWLNPAWRTPIFAILLVSGGALTGWANCRWGSEAQTRYLVAAVVVLVVALVLWDLDRTLVLCYPTSVFQGHAVWHMMTAIAAVLLYLYICSEHVLRYQIGVGDLGESIMMDNTPTSTTTDTEGEDIFDYSRVVAT